MNGRSPLRSAVTAACSAVGRLAPGSGRINVDMTVPAALVASLLAGTGWRSSGAHRHPLRTRLCLSVGRLDEVRPDT
jgi:hypothetical protein